MFDVATTVPSDPTAGSSPIEHPGWVYHVESAPSWGELTDRLHQCDREGWEVVNFVVRDAGFVAFLRRGKGIGRRTGG